MEYSKPEVNQIGSAEELVLADPPGGGQDSDTNGTSYPYRNAGTEDEFSAV
jgi:hypothetical protein